MTAKSGFFLLLTAGAVQAAFDKQKYVDAHNVLAAKAGSIYVANEWSSFANDAARPLAKHTPTLTIDKDKKAKITVRHVAESAHWIEAIWVEDTEGTVCGSCEFPANEGEVLPENTCLIQLPGACSAALDEVIPFESCNLHGIWEGQESSVVSWGKWHTYIDNHKTLGYTPNVPSNFSADTKPKAKHTPVVKVVLKELPAACAVCDAEGAAACFKNGVLNTTNAFCEKAGACTPCYQPPVYVADITVAHGSIEAHWIEGVGLFDQNGELYLQQFSKPTAAGDYVNDKQVAKLELPAHVQSFTPFESCNLHGIWQGQVASVTAWAAYASYFMQHATLKYTPDVPSSHANEVATKHTPVTANVTFDDSSVATVHVKVKHGSTSAHFIESIYLMDQNKELYLMKKDKPIEDGSYDSDVATQAFVLPEHVTEVTPFEFCNIHGVWVGSPVYIEKHRDVEAYYVLHEALQPYKKIEISYPEDETTTKHAPTIKKGTGTDNTFVVHVAHGSSSAHYIEATWAYDQNGELYGPEVDAAPDSTGEYDTGSTAQEYTLVHKNVVSLLPYEYCNLHGIWAGRTTSWPLAEESAPTPTPTEKPAPAPTEKPAPAPTEKPAPAPTEEPAPSPTKSPTKKPATPVDEPPLEIKMNAAITFDNKLESKQITEVTDAMEGKVADDLNIPQSYVTAEMTETKNGRRRLLAVKYEVVIIISIPAAEAAEMVQNNSEIAELSDPRNAAAIATSFEASLGQIPALKEANGGKDVTVLVDVEVVSVPDEVEPSSASKVCTAFGVLASAMYVAYTL